MDSNGLRCFGLSWGRGLHGWQGGGSAVEAAPQHRVTGVRLASRAEPLPLRETAQNVDEVVLAPAMAVDALGNHVHWDGEALVSTSHLAAREGLASLPFVLPAEALPVTDLAPGDDDVLYLAAGGAVWFADLRARFALTAFDAPAEFSPQRLATAPGGGAWVLDSTRGEVLRLTGRPETVRPLYVDRAWDDRLDATPTNPDPPRWQQRSVVVPAGERAVAIATHRHGRVLVLSLVRPNGGMRLRLRLDDGRWSLPLRLAGPRFGATLAWLDGERIAVATRGVLEGERPRDPGVYTYALPPPLLDRWAAASAEGADTLPEDLDDPLPALGDYWPLAGWTGGPFAATRPGDSLHYPRERAEGGIAPQRVARVSAATRARYGVLANVLEDRAPGARVLAAAGLLDSGDAGTVWHRLVAEAAVPAGSAMIVWLATSDSGMPAFEPAAPTRRAPWQPHLIGDRAALPPDVAAELPVDAPRAVRLPTPTEVPHGQPLLCCAEAPTAGAFGVLIQRAGVAVRSLQGPRLWVVVELFGDGRATPELAALRAWSGRVSYRDRYLPALYHERLFGADADRAGPASGADFLGRYLHLFEGLFTEIEDRVAASALFSDPMACPPEALPWLAGWVGIALEPGLPPERARWMIANAARLAQRHGTLDGLKLALDIATDGGVTCGRIVVVEDFRLRRTLATILGADLVDRHDPLTQGLAVSGNSVVGDALFLGDVAVLDDPARQTFLALFRRLEGADEGRAAARRAVFDALANRVTILLHEQASADEAGLVQKLAGLGAPAHVLVRVIRAAWPFMVGVASLIGADSFLRAPPPPRPVRAGPGPETSALGSIDTLRGEASLDAHAGALSVLQRAPAPSAPPRAVARVRDIDPTAATPGDSPFRLDGRRSSADTGRHITTWHWVHLPPA